MNKGEETYSLSHVCVYSVGRPMLWAEVFDATWVVEHYSEGWRQRVIQRMLEEAENWSFQQCLQ